MPNNPSQDLSGFVTFFPYASSTRKYQFIIRDSIFDDRQNDYEFILGIVGSFNEEVILSNITFKNSEITFRASAVYFVYNLTVDGHYFESNLVNAGLLFHVNL